MPTLHVNALGTLSACPLHELYHNVLFNNASRFIVDVMCTAAGQLNPALQLNHHGTKTKININRSLFVATSSACVFAGSRTQAARGADCR